jgi:hypothetical protein
MKDKKQPEAKKAEFTVRQTEKAFQDVIVSMKLRKVSPNISIELEAAFGGADELRQHMKNLSDAVHSLQKTQNSVIKDAARLPDGAHYVPHDVVDGTRMFRAKNKILDHYSEGGKVKLNAADLEDALTLLRAYGFVQKSQKK